MSTAQAHTLRGNGREARQLRRLLNQPDIRVFLPTNAHEAGIFKACKGRPELLDRVTAPTVEGMAEEGVLLEVRTSKAGRLFRAVPPNDRVRRPRTAKDRRGASWLAAEKVFASGPDGTKSTIPVNLAESPIGWLARRRNPNGQPFLSRDEVAAGERLRADFERSQLGPNVTQDWRRFLTAGASGGRGSSVQERDIGGGADAARRRLSEALDALGPGLSDAALRICCFLEGVEAMETAMQWSRRSGKVVLKLALQRLADFYENASTRHRATLESWRAPEG